MWNAIARKRSYSVRLFLFSVKSLGENSAVLLPAEEVTDPEVSTETKWIPELENEFSDEFYPDEEPTAKKNANKKQSKKKSANQKKAIKRKSIEAEDESEEDETVTLENVD